MQCRRRNPACCKRSPADVPADVAGDAAVQRALRQQVTHMLKVAWCSPTARCLVGFTLVVMCAPRFRAIREAQAPSDDIVDEDPRVSVGLEISEDPLSTSSVCSAAQGCVTTDDGTVTAEPCFATCSGGCLGDRGMCKECTAPLVKNGEKASSSYARCMNPHAHWGREYQFEIDDETVIKNIDYGELWTTCLDGCKNDPNCIGIAWRYVEMVVKVGEGKSETEIQNLIQETIDSLTQAKRGGFLRDKRQDSPTKGFVLKEVNPDGTLKFSKFRGHDDQQGVYMCARIPDTWAGPAKRTGAKGAGFYLRPKSTCEDMACETCMDTKPDQCIECKEPFALDDTQEWCAGKCILKVPQALYGSSAVETHRENCQEPEDTDLEPYSDPSLFRMLARCRRACQIETKCGGYIWEKASGSGGATYSCHYCEAGSEGWAGMHLTQNAQHKNDRERGMVLLRRRANHRQSLKDQPLVQPPILEPSENGYYELEIKKVTLEFPGVTVTTRGYNGMVPGPTIRVKPNPAFNPSGVGRCQDNAICVAVKLNNSHDGFDKNDLQPHERAEGFTQCNHHNPTDTNLHAHGWHVDPEEDDVFETVHLGQNLAIVMNLPSDHHAGSSWYHPHVHGTTSIQVMGGLAGGLIIEDDWTGALRSIGKAKKVLPSAFNRWDQPDDKNNLGYNTRKDGLPEEFDYAHNLIEWLQAMTGDYDVTLVLQQWKFRNDCEAAEEVIAFDAGEMGARFDEHGVVHTVLSDSPAQSKGIQKGFLITKVNNAKFNQDALAAAEHSGERYQVTVSKGAHMIGPYKTPFNKCLGTLLHNVHSTGDQAVKAEFKDAGWMNKEFLTVNGQFKPFLTMKKDKWYRFRFIYAGASSIVSIAILDGNNQPSCEVFLLAKDGIYVEDLPRKLGEITGDRGILIAPGGRADVAVRCSKPSHIVTKEMPSKIWSGLAVDGDLPVMTLKVVGLWKNIAHQVLNRAAVIPETERVLTPAPDSAEGNFFWKPWYLSDLRQELIGEDQLYTITYAPVTWSGGRKQLCRSMGLSVCNDISSCFPPNGPPGFYKKSGSTMKVFEGTDPPLATFKKDQSVHFKIELFHVHHMHVYPVQLYKAVPGSFLTTDEYPNYFKEGDWHDTLQLGGDWHVRMKAANFGGKIVIHCHMLEHEDSGMMGYLKVQ